MGVGRRRTSEVGKDCLLHSQKQRVDVIELDRGRGTNGTSVTDKRLLLRPNKPSSQSPDQMCEWEGCLFSIC